MGESLILRSVSMLKIESSFHLIFNLESQS